MFGIGGVWLERLGLVVVVAILPPACSANEPEPAVDIDPSASAYYRLRQDLRRCAPPLCGGVWVEAVNQPATPCIDGDRRAACYVAEVEWRASGVAGGEGATLVRGRQATKDFAGVGALGVFVAEEAYRPATSGEATGRWYGLRHNGVVCVTHPCFAIDQRPLNGADEQAISGVDLDRVGASPEDAEAARRAIARGELIAVGENVVTPDQGPAGAGVTLVASQFFLRLAGEAK